METDYRKKIGSTIKIHRKKQNMTQQDLADSINKSLRTVQGYENGTINIPMPSLEQIALALDIPLIEIIGNSYYDETTGGFYFIFEDNEKEKELMRCFNALNETGQNEALKRVSELAEIEKYQK
ncbi:MAG: helix-turn-helix transcriptional regulator [Firmicutes bacterium]|nr:helix-turn-helix transcriptional regulator [Bacillota bacterium]